MQKRSKNYRQNVNTSQFYNHSTPLIAVRNAEKHIINHELAINSLIAMFSVNCR